MDLTAAYDTVNHIILLKVAKTIGNKTIVGIIQSLLNSETDGYFFVVDD